MVYSNFDCLSASCLSSTFRSFDIGKAGGHLLGKSCPLGLCCFNVYTILIVCIKIQKYVPLRALNTFVRKKMGHTT